MNPFSFIHRSARRVAAKAGAPLALALACAGFLQPCAPQRAIAAADPIAWVSGSSQSSQVYAEQTGNKVTLVNMATRAKLGTFTVPESSNGADPLPTAFSRDGSIAYVLVGGFDPRVDLGDTRPVDKTSRIFVYRTDSLMAALNPDVEAGVIAPQQILVVPPNSGNPDDSTNAEEPSALSISPDGLRAYLVVTDEEKLVCYDIEQADGATKGNLTQIAVLDTLRQPTRLDITKDSSKGFLASFKDRKVQVFSLTGTPALVTDVDTPGPTNSGQHLGDGTVGVFANPGATMPLLYTEPADDSVYLVYSGGFGPAGAVSIPNPFFPFPPTITVTLAYSFNVYAINTTTNGVVTVVANQPAGATDAVWLPALTGSQIPVSGGGAESIFNVAGTQSITNVSFAGASATRTSLPSTDATLIRLFQFVPDAERTGFIGSLAAPNMSTIVAAYVAGTSPLPYNPVRNTTLVYREDYSGAPPAEATWVTIDRYSCGVLGSSAEEIWIGGNDIVSAPGTDATSQFDFPDPRVTLLVWATRSGSTGTINATLNMPYAGGAIAIQPAAGSTEPTPTPTATASATETSSPTPTQTASPTETEAPTPSASPTLTPSPTESLTPTASPTETATPVPTVESDPDGDGFSSEVEAQYGSGEGDPNSRPLVGDADGNGRTDLRDAIALYRAVQGHAGSENIVRWDFNNDGICDAADALFLYRWLLRAPGYETIGYAQVIPATP